MLSIHKIFDSEGYTYYICDGIRRYKVLDYLYSPKTFTTSIVLDGVQDILILDNKIF